MPSPRSGSPALTDDDLPGLAAGLGLPGIFDVHVHFMPDRIQEAVWAHFDRQADPPWPMVYRARADERLARLARMGVVRHTALAYAHRPGVATWLNAHTLDLAGRHHQIVPTFTLFPEPGVTDYVGEALAAGGRCVKVHLQVSKFDLTDPLLDEAWALLEAAGTPIVVHLAAVDDGSGGEAFCRPEALWRLLDRHPGLRPVVAHLGAPDLVAELFDRAAELPELRFDTAMAVVPTVQIWTPPDWLPGRLAELGDRILFGSDYPHLPLTVADQVAALVGFGLGDDWLRGVLWHNAAALFDASG
ncbi:MAG TPA: amidohydrolase family protein [Acidimicrobiia bacterium]|nr:amidohydrolase family protein [Acidimicrobiia bacterium]